MDNILTYARTQFSHFCEEPFNEIDSTVFSWLSYLVLPDELPGLTSPTGIRLKELFLAEYFESMAGKLLDKENTLALLSAACASPRFRDARVLCYVQDLNTDRDKQFAAVTFEYAPGEYYIAFRGTDCTFTGWKEDLNLAYLYPVPSQESARDYLENLGQYLLHSVPPDYSSDTEVNIRIRVGGHSKGGNLAVYSAMKCSDTIRAKLCGVYSHDGPGFPPEIVASPEYHVVCGILHKTVPQSSLVGMLLFQEKNYKIVESTAVTGIAQHNCFTWKTEGNHFITADHLSNDAILLNKTLNEWVLKLPEEERKLFIDTVFHVIESTDSEDFMEFGADLKTSLSSIASEIRKTSLSDRITVLKTIGLLAKLGIKNIPDSVNVTLPGIAMKNKPDSDGPS